jgi:hypothetical protein
MAEDYEDLEMPQDSEYIDIEDPNEPEPFVYDEEDPNLVAAFQDHEEGEEALKKIVQYARDCFDDSWDSSSEYRDRVAKDWKLFAGDLPKKSFPFENCANGNIPIFIENTLRIHARLSSEIFGDWTSTVGVVPVGPEDEAMAEAISKHDNWQMREGIPDFSRQMERGLLNFIVSGDVTGHSFYDDKRQENRHESLTPDEFVVPYTLVSTMPDYSDVPYYCKVLYRYRHDLQAMRHKWENVDDVLDKQTPSWENDPESPIRSAIGDTQGEAVPETEHNVPFKLIQFEGYCSYLPNQAEDRFIQCIFDPVTMQPLSLRIHEEVHWKDEAKRRTQEAELSQYTGALNQVTELREEQSRKREAAFGDALERGATSEEQEALLLQHPHIELPDPVAPEWVADPDNPPDAPPPAAKTPIRMFSHGVNIEPMLGGLGLGYGRIQADFTRGANTMFNQWIDAATLANAPPVFTNIDLPRDTSFMPGKFTKIAGAFGEEMASSFYSPPIAGANPQLLEGVGKMYDFAQSSAQAPDVLSGAPGKSGETFRGISSRIEQATKQLSSMGRKFSTTFFTQVLRNNARLNSIYLDEVQHRSVLNGLTQQYENLEIRRDMYERDYNVELRADLRFTSETQKQQEAMELVQLPAAVPQLQMNNAFMYDALVDFFKSKKRPDLIPALGAKPAPPPEFGAPPAPPPGMAPPGMEGAPPEPGIPGPAGPGEGGM